MHFWTVSKKWKCRYANFKNIRIYLLKYLNSIRIHTFKCSNIRIIGIFEFKYPNLTILYIALVGSKCSVRIYDQFVFDILTLCILSEKQSKNLSFRITSGGLCKKIYFANWAFLLIWGREQRIYVILNKVKM